MKKIVFIALSLFSSIAFCQQINNVAYEQIAFNYFIDEIINKEFPKNIKFSFSEEISAIASGIAHFPCFEDYKEYFKYSDSVRTYLLKLNQDLSKSKTSKNIESINDRFLIIKQGREGKIRVNKKNKHITVNSVCSHKIGFYLVEIVVFSKNIQDRYFIEVEKEGKKITRYCKRLVVY
jgi:hypothetical protein